MITIKKILESLNATKRYHEIYDDYNIVIINGSLCKNPWDYSRAEAFINYLERYLGLNIIKLTGKMFQPRTPIRFKLSIEEPLDELINQGDY